MFGENKARCTVCGATITVSTVDIAAVPVYCNVLWATRDQALDAATGDISLAFCEHCGHFFNSSFDASKTDYSEDYDNSLHYSPHFSGYAKDLAKRLVDCYELKNKDIIEIGCGKGDFLRLLCAEGDNRGVGFDQSYDPTRETEQHIRGVTFTRDFYGSKYMHLPVDFLCCRHVLEHIDQPLSFLRSLRGWIGKRIDTVLYFEVPNALFTIRAMGIWDLIYEHPSYFSRDSLTYAFESSGFSVLGVGESFGGQFLYIEAKPLALEQGEESASVDSDAIELLKTDALTFKARYESKLNEWRDNLATSRWRKSVIWGGGSKGVTFLNAMRGAQINYVVDLNPYKQGKFVPGTGQQVIAPKSLIGYAPDEVIVMNELYRDEIAQSLNDMGIDAFLSVV